MSSFGNSVSASVQKEVLDEEKLLKKGKLDIFKGPLKDREGHERLKAGQKADFQWLSTMDFFVPGINGALPKG